MLSGHIRLYRDIADSPVPSTERELPVDSDNLDDWAALAGSREEDLWNRDCRPEVICTYGAEPTAQVYAAVTTYLHGRVGNLEFETRVTYRSTDLPPDVELRNVAILRDLVLAALAGRERVE